MKFNISYIFLYFIPLTVCAQSPVIVSDVTIQYSLSGSAVDAATKTVYFKGRMIRTDLQSVNYHQTLINNTKNIVLLKEIGNEKYLMNLPPDYWKKENERFENSKISFTEKTENILGYECKNAVLTLSDGTRYNIFYTPKMNTAVPENSYEFGQFPGLVLKYEITGPKDGTIVSTASSISLDIIPKSKFDIPSTGYRVLTDPELF